MQARERVVLTQKKLNIIENTLGKLMGQEDEVSRLEGELDDAKVKRQSFEDKLEADRACMIQLEDEQDQAEQGDQDQRDYRRYRQVAGLHALQKALGRAPGRLYRVQERGQGVAEQVEGVGDRVDAKNKEAGEKQDHDDPVKDSHRRQPPSRPPSRWSAARRPAGPRAL